jgi:hypothetical protein
MKQILETTAAFLLAGLLIPSLFAAPTKSTKTTTHHSTSSSSTTAHSKTSKKSAHGHKLHGQQAIDPERVSQIQAALIKVHYLNGEPNGEWNSTTIAAMQKFQSDNNWQTKLMPDARALMKLGLGPDYSDAINAKGSSFASPSAQPPAATPLTSGFVDASGVKQ